MSYQHTRPKVINIFSLYSVNSIPDFKIKLIRYIEHFSVTFYLVAYNISKTSIFPAQILQTFMVSLN